MEERGLGKKLVWRIPPLFLRTQALRCARAAARFVFSPYTFVSSEVQLESKTPGRPKVRVQLSRTHGAASCATDGTGGTFPLTAALEHLSIFPLSQNRCATAVCAAGTASELCNVQMCLLRISPSGVLFSCFRL